MNSMNKKYVSIGDLRNDLYVGWWQGRTIGTEYREISGTLTGKGRHWYKRLGSINNAIDDLGKANGKANESEVKYLESVRDALVKCRHRGYLKRSISEGSTSENTYNSTIGNMNRYISEQKTRLERERHESRKTSTARRASAVAGFMLANIISFSSDSGGGNSGAEAEALRLLARSTPACTAAADPGFKKGYTESEADKAIDNALKAFAPAIDPSGEPGRKVVSYGGVLLEEFEAEPGITEAGIHDMPDLEADPVSAEDVVYQDLMEPMEGPVELSDDDVLAMLNENEVEGEVETSHPAYAMDDIGLDMKVDLGEPDADEPAYEDIQSELNELAPDEPEYDPDSDSDYEPRLMADEEAEYEPVQAEEDHSCYGSDSEVDFDDGWVLHDDTAADNDAPRHPPAIRVYLANRPAARPPSKPAAKPAAEEYKPLKDVEPITPEQNDLYSPVHPVRDVFGGQVLIKPFDADAQEEDRLVVFAAELWAYLNMDEHAAQYIAKARKINPKVNLYVIDTNGDLKVDETDKPIDKLAARDRGLARFYLKAAEDSLSKGDTIDAFRQTYVVLMYDGQAGDEVSSIRDRCVEKDGILVPVAADIAAYGDWLLFEGDVTGPDGKKIKPNDVGMYPTTLEGSIEFTEYHAKKLGDDTALVMEKHANTAAGNTDYVLNFLGRGTGALFAGFGKHVLCIPELQGVSHRKQFEEAMKKVEERARDAYGKSKEHTYFGHPPLEPVEDCWMIGNDVANVAFGGVYIAHNATIRPLAEGIGTAINGEQGFSDGHNLANATQIPICALNEGLLVFGDAEPRKVQSNLNWRAAQDLGLLGRTGTDVLDRNLDGKYGIGEILGSTAGVQWFAAPVDPYYPVTGRFVAWALNLAQIEAIGCCLHHGHSHGGGSCDPPGRSGGSPVPGCEGAGRGAGAPGR